MIASPPCSSLHLPAPCCIGVVIYRKKRRLEKYGFLRLFPAVCVCMCACVRRGCCALGGLAARLPRTCGVPMRRMLSALLLPSLPAVVVVVAGIPNCLLMPTNLTNVVVVVGISSKNFNRRAHKKHEMGGSCSRKQKQQAAMQTAARRRRRSRTNYKDGKGLEIDIPLDHPHMNMGAEREIL